MWRSFALLVLAVPLASAVDLGDNMKLSVQNEFQYYNNAVSGSNPSGSFLTPGRFATENLSLTHHYGKDDSNWDTAVDVRETDDPRVETKRYNLKRFFTKFSNQSNEAVLGDYLASFSQYSLNTSLKGVSYVHRSSTQSVTISIILGMPKANWDDLWNNNLTETVDRKYYGARIEKKLLGDGVIGINAVESDDSRARFNATAALENQRIFSSDWALPKFRDLSLRGETAYSRTDTDNPTSPATSQDGWAHLVKAEYSHDRFSSQDDFERVSNDYATTGGAASPDLLRFGSQNKVKIAGPWSATANYSWFHNNVNGELDNTTTTVLPEGGARYEAPDWRPSFSAESKLRYRMVTSSSKGARQRVRSIANNVTDRFWNVDTTVDYEFQHEDASDGSSSLRHHILGVGLNTQWDLPHEVKLTPNLHWNLQRDRNNLIAATDQTTVTSASLKASFPQSVDAAVAYSRNLVANAVNPGSDRRSFTATVGYNILKSDANRLEANFIQNDNRFTTAAQDFKEKVASLNFKAAF